MNMMQRMFARDDEMRTERKKALSDIENGKKNGLRFVLEAIDCLQNARQNLRFAIRATEEAARLELKYVKFLYWEDMNRNIDDFRKMTDKSETLCEFLIEAVRTLYDEATESRVIDLEKWLAQLRNGLNIVSPDFEDWTPACEVGDNPECDKTEN